MKFTRSGLTRHCTSRRTVNKKVKWLGNGLRAHDKNGVYGAIKRRVAEKALETMKERVRQITGRSRGRSLQSIIVELRSYLVGWKAYFRLAERLTVFRELDQWIRRRLRMVQLKQWRRGPRIFRALCARGAPPNVAASAAAHAHRWWRIARHPALNIALPPREFDRLGLPRLAS